MTERDNELEKRKDAAYNKGLDWGYSNKPVVSCDVVGLPHASAEYDAFLAGYEDGQAMKEQ